MRIKLAAGVDDRQVNNSTVIPARLPLFPTPFIGVGI